MNNLFCWYQSLEGIVCKRIETPYRAGRSKHWLKLKNRASGEESVLPVSAMFLGIGHEPNAKAFTGLLDLDPDGYILTKNNVFTTLNGEILPGVFACGDIQDRRYRQAITAAGSGCMAALEVEKYLEEHGR